MSTRFNRLNVPDQWNNYWTKYPQGYTILEALLNWVAQVDSMVDNVNDWNEYLDEFVLKFDSELAKTVEDLLKEWQDSGFLDVIIDEALQTEIDLVEDDLRQRSVNIMFPPAPLQPALGDGVTDDTARINAIIAYVMKTGGGQVFFPAKKFLIMGTIYTHDDTFTLDDSWGYLHLKGASPLSFSLYRAGDKGATILYKPNTGNIIETNHTPAKDVVLPNGALFRNFTVTNIMFQGTGLKDALYPDMYATVTQTNAIELHRTSIFMRDCLFDTVYRGVYAKNSMAAGGDNYCDQTNIERCGFRNIGYSWIEASVADASNFAKLYGYRMARTCKYGVRVVKGTSFTIDTLLCSAQHMQLCPDFHPIDIYFANNVQIKNPYLENVTSPHVYLDTVDNIHITGMGCRHYRGSLVVGTYARNVKIEDVYSYVEENKKLSASDNGDFDTYDTITPPYDFDFDSNCYNIEYGMMNLIHATHSTPSFPKVSERYFPKVKKVAPGERGQEFGLVIFGESGSIIVSVNGQRMANPEYLLGATKPTFNITTGELTFPQTGIFAHSPFISATGRRSATTSKLNNVYAINNYTFRLTDSTGALLTDINDVALNVTVKF